MSTLIAGIVLGLAGTAHCAAMCGPLVLLAHARGGAGRPAARVAAWGRLAAYHAGRAVTYVALGVLAGAAGDTVAGAGFGRALAVAAGVMLLSHVMVPPAAGRWSLRLSRPLTAAIARLAEAARRARLDVPVVHGALHGVLPCGVLYLAVAAAAGFGGISHAVLFMGGFVVGTTPVLAVIALTGPALAGRLPPVVQRAAPVGVGLVGLLLVARGLGMPPGGHGAHAIPLVSTAGTSLTHPATAPHAH